MNLPPFYLLPRPFFLLGLTRGGDGEKIRVRDLLFDSILPIRFSVLLISFLFVHPNGKLGLGLGFRPFFSSSLFGFGSDFLLSERI